MHVPDTFGLNYTIKGKSENRMEHMQHLKLYLENLKA